MSRPDPNSLLASSLEIWNQGFCVEDLGVHAQQGVDRMMQAIKRDAEQE
jgi:hypothetical protein